jgi:hypothetical protein
MKFPRCTARSIDVRDVSVRCEAIGASCSKCGAWSEAFHSSYARNLADLPISGRQAVVDLRGRRFRCYQPVCPRKPSSNKSLCWLNATLTGHAGSGRCSNRSTSLWAAGRRILVDTGGLILRAKVHTADVQDRAAVPLLLDGADEQFPRITHLWVDQGYTGSGKHWIETQLGWNVEVVRHPPQPRGEWVPHGDRSNWRTVWFSW